MSRKFAILAPRTEGAPHTVHFADSSRAAETLKDGLAEIDGIAWEVYARVTLPKALNKDEVRQRSADERERMLAEHAQRTGKTD